VGHGRATGEAFDILGVGVAHTGELGVGSFAIEQQDVRVYTTFMGTQV
jgi:hypothetical protein